MYDDILTLNWDKPDIFIKEGQKRCLLFFDYSGYKASFILGLNPIPKIAEDFDFGFINPKNGGSSYHVEKVYHQIENGEHNITIRLTSREPNIYLQLLKEKAYLRRDITLSEAIYPTTHKLERELIKMYTNL
jgi:hypothetical protein